jgi:hypothetical protein
VDRRQAQPGCCGAEASDERERGRRRVGAAAAERAGLGAEVVAEPDDRPVEAGVRRGSHDERQVGVHAPIVAGRCDGSVPAV